jgi:hypothetical protein
MNAIRRMGRVGALQGRIALVGALLMGAALPCVAQTPGSEDLQARLRAGQVDFSLRLSASFAARDRAPAFQPSPLEAPADPKGSTFFHGMLLPRLNRSLDEMAPYRGVPHAQSQLDDFVLFDELTNAVGRRAEKATRRAVKEYLLETTPLGRGLIRLKSGGRRDIAGGIPAARPTSSRRDALSFGLTVSHNLPEVQARYDIMRGTLRVGVRADGSVGFSLDHEKLARTRLWFGYDAEDGAYDLQCRVRF